MRKVTFPGAFWSREWPHGHHIGSEAPRSRVSSFLILFIHQFYFTVHLPTSKPPKGGIGLRIPLPNQT